MVAIENRENAMRISHRFLDVYLVRIVANKSDKLKIPKNYLSSTYISNFELLMYYVNL